jgi:hypothetical protein
MTNRIDAFQIWLPGLRDPDKLVGAKRKFRFIGELTIEYSIIMQWIPSDEIKCAGKRGFNRYEAHL